MSVQKLYRRAVVEANRPRRVSMNPVDETHPFTVILLAEPKATIMGIRTYDNIEEVWYEVHPEMKQAYCTPGAGALHVVFGGMNVGGVNGYIWGKLTDDEGKEIIPETPQWCAVGAFVWWEKTIDMPARDYGLTVEVGH